MRPEGHGAFTWCLLSGYRQLTDRIGETTESRVQWRHGTGSGIGIDSVIVKGGLNFSTQSDRWCMCENTSKKVASERG
jgi:hypothetical protein